MPLTPYAAGRAYDRIGRVQDAHGFNEDAATSRLGELASLDSARAVFELGSRNRPPRCQPARRRAGCRRSLSGCGCSPTTVRLARAAAPLGAARLSQAARAAGHHVDVRLTAQVRTQQGGAG